ncbi:hypothetical protein [Nocardia blacklockiae]|uniref:hypothetical protein n=1 Tax=Nocardia blacklockiae TaxID=480036 RepID=UPI00189429F7|nr:hypothetical protein [Nocardia blacklockiae]MBF6176007.1 hypothetical protein [Nocardia blacklockiae]
MEAQLLVSGLVGAVAGASVQAGVQWWNNRRHGRWASLKDDAALAKDLPEGPTKAWLNDYVELRVQLYGLDETRPRRDLNRLLGWWTFVLVGLFTTGLALLASGVWARLLIAVGEPENQIPPEWRTWNPQALVLFLPAVLLFLFARDFVGWLDPVYYQVRGLSSFVYTPIRRTIEVPAHATKTQRWRLKAREWSDSRRGPLPHPEEGELEPRIKDLHEKIAALRRAGDSTEVVSSDPHTAAVVAVVPVPDPAASAGQDPPVASRRPTHGGYPGP